MLDVYVEKHENFRKMAILPYKPQQFFRGVLFFDVSPTV